MQPTILTAFLDLAGIPVSMSAACLALLVIGLLAAKNDIAQATGIAKIVALTPVCFAIPLAAFGAEHLSGGIPLQMVPSYMPWRFVLAVFRGLCAHCRIVEHRHSDSGALVRRAGRDHDVSLCGDVASAGGDQGGRPNRVDDRDPGNVVRRRRLGFGRKCDGRKQRGAA